MPETAKGIYSVFQPRTVYCRLSWVRHYRHTLTENTSHCKIIADKVCFYGGIVVVDMKQAQRAEQRLLLTQAMRQSLGVLQMALPELREYIQDQALSNPLLEIEETHEHLSVESLLRQNSDTIQTSWRDESLDDLTARRTNCDGWKELELGSKDGEGDFTDQLYDQLLGMKWLSEPMKGLCEYLILCLNDRGYLEFELSEIAHELQVPMFDVEQVLYIVQSLQPAGVGARTLSECLVLQLRTSTPGRCGPSRTV